MNNPYLSNLESQKSFFPPTSQQRIHALRFHSHGGNCQNNRRELDSFSIILLVTWLKTIHFIWFVLISIRWATSLENRYPLFALLLGSCGHVGVSLSYLDLSVFTHRVSGDMRIKKKKGFHVLYQSHSTGSSTVEPCVEWIPGLQSGPITADMTIRGWRRAVSTSLPPG